MFRVIETIFTFALVILLCPLFLAIALALFLTNKDGIFFLQSRAGYLNEKFFIIKFRTMLELFDENNVLLPPHSRITKFGKILRRFKLDELPNLFNIIKGEMSIIGPRAKLVTEVAMRKDLSVKRQSMRPGMTGWSQVSGNTKLSIDEMFLLDIWYIKNRSLFIDFMIIVKTVLVLFTGEQRNEALIRKTKNELSNFHRSS